MHPIKLQMSFLEQAQMTKIFTRKMQFWTPFGHLNLENTGRHQKTVQKLFKIEKAETLENTGNY